MVSRRENSTLIAVVIALFSAVFCGYGLTVRQAKIWNIYFVWFLQFNMWAAQANFSETLELYDHVYDTSFANLEYGYSLNQTGTDYAMMAVIGTLWRFLAFLAMIYCNREKQK